MLSQDNHQLRENMVLRLLINIHFHRHGSKQMHSGKVLISGLCNHQFSLVPSRLKRDAHETQANILLNLSYVNTSCFRLFDWTIALIDCDTCKKCCWAPTKRNQISTLPRQTHSSSGRHKYRLKKRMTFEEGLKKMGTWRPCVVAIFWARVLCYLAVEEARFRTRIILGVVLVRSLACVKRIPGWLRSGSGVSR